jgi:DNA primase
VIFVAIPALQVEVAGRSVRVSNPDKVFFPAGGHTTLDLVEDYVAVSGGALRGVFERPTVLERFPDGAFGEPNFGETVPPNFPKAKGEPRRVAPSRACRQPS